MNTKSDSPQEKASADNNANALKDWSWLDAIVGTFSDDFLADGREQPTMQERPELDEPG